MWLSWLRIHLQCRRPKFDPRVGKIPWKRERLSTPVFWSGEFHGLYSPWGRKESDTTERRPLSFLSFSPMSFIHFFNPSKHLPECWRNRGLRVVFVLVAQSCPTLCDPNRLLCPWNSPGRNTGVSCRSLLQGIFPTQRSNLGLLHCRQILDRLSHEGSPPNH